MDENILLEKHLLVIDDEVEITRSIFRQFRKKYKVYTATSGNDAVELMEQYPIQVVISDQRMPGMTGVDFFSKIKYKYPDALKMILTGYSDIEAVIGAINEGQVFRYITKPWNPVELDMAVDEAFEKYDLIASNRKLVKELHETNLSLEKKVTERTAEIKKANEMLKMLNIEKNKYIGIVAHDLRNPIGNAYSFSDLLLSDLHRFSVKEQMEFLRIINERCSYSLQLIEDFLDTSKIESGILDLDFKEHNYINIVNGCIAQNKMFAQKKSQQILFDVKQEEMIVLCDRNKIEQVLNNLISNAIKYSPGNKRIWIELEKNNHQLITRVTDEGQGIPENELESIFKVYQTTSTQATAGEKSTGLGLAIVKKIVEAHNGSIGVKSQVGMGSEFWFGISI